MSQRVGAIEYNPKEAIGQGSSSVVFRGSFGKRVVAVKRVESTKTNLIESEVNILQTSDGHPNIIRYFHSERDTNFTYIALDLCSFTLKDYISRSDLKAKITPRTIISQMIQAMEWLHKLSVVHRDIKPTNVLLLEKSPGEFEVKISDFGFAKQIQVSDSQMSVIPDESNYWMPPEMAQGKYTKKSDVYTMGCLIFYVAKSGEIAKRSISLLPSLSETSRCALLNHMLIVMTKPDPNERPSFHCLRFHPYFWDNQKILNFFLSVADRVKVRDGPASQAASYFQEDCREVISSSWLDRLDDVVISSLAYRSSRHNYDGNSISELLRALRNKEAHYDEMSAAAKATYGALPDGYTEYWTGKFPLLLMHVYLKVHKSGLYRDENFIQYYPQDQTCDNARN